MTTLYSNPEVIAADRQATVLGIATERTKIEMRQTPSGKIFFTMITGSINSLVVRDKKQPKDFTEAELRADGGFTLITVNKQNNEIVKKHYRDNKNEGALLTTLLPNDNIAIGGSVTTANIVYDKWTQNLLDDPLDGRVDPNEDLPKEIKYLFAAFQCFSRQDGVSESFDFILIKDIDHYFDTGEFPNMYTVNVKNGVILGIDIRRFKKEDIIDTLLEDI